MQGSTAAIMQAANLYVFVTNNPIMWLDPWGLYRVNTVDYARARGATVTNLARNADGQNRMQITYGNVSRTFTVNSGFIQDYTLNNIFGWSSFLTQADRDHGVGIVITGGNLYRNVTAPVNAALTRTANHAMALQIMAIANITNAPGRPTLVSNVLWFYNQVNHNAPWDIKEPNSWRQTIGSTHPGRMWTGGGYTYTHTYFRGQRMTAESIGNFTYGYIGAALGLPLPVLLAGSWYADGFTTGQTFANNELVDWGYIQRGVNAFRRR